MSCNAFDRGRARPSMIAACAVLALAGGPVFGHSPATAGHDHVAPAPAARAPERAVVRVADLALTDQDGRPRRLRSDVLGEAIVVIDFVYTSCTTVCPVMSSIMAEVQGRLRERIGGELKLVSLSIDPARDTPARLRQYARGHGAGPGWTWLTGTPSVVAEALKGFGTWSPRFEDHPVVLMVGDARSGEWTRFYGFVDPALVVAQVDALTHARHTSGD